MLTREGGAEEASGQVGVTVMPLRGLYEAAA
jgi:hypothetical protein